MQAAGYGVCAGLGVVFISIHMVLPFIIVGIGVDDMFIIVAAFDAQDDKLPSSERLALALRRCGISITYTSVTDVVAFYLGATSALPAIQVFCLYAATSILFNYVFQITMFSALLCLDANRIQAGKVDVFCCLSGASGTSSKPGCGCCGAGRSHPSSVGSTSEREEDNNAPESMEEGGSPVSDTVAGIEMVPVSTSLTTARSTTADGDYTGKGGDGDGIATICATASEAQEPNASHGKKAHYTSISTEKPLTPAQWLLAEYYWPLLQLPAVRIAIVLVFLGLLGACTWGATEVTQGFDVADLTPDDSYVRSYISAARELDLFIFEDNSPVEIVFKDISYHEQQTQEEMLDVQDGFTAARFRHNSGPFSSWIEDFTAWVQSSDSPYQGDVNSDGYLTKKSLFYEAVADFIALPQYERYERDIEFKKDGTIQASRITAYHVDLFTPEEQIDAMEDARDYVSGANLSPKPIVYAEAYLNIETEVIIGGEMVLNLSLVLVAVALVSFFVLFRPGAVLLVIVIVAVIDVDIIGAMHFWDLKVNTVTVVQLVMAVGLVVDYVAHILHYYLQQPFSLSPQQRLRAALIEIGPSVLLGCTTTFIGILPLAWASSVIFRTFFRMFFLIIVFGAGHGLLLLPAILPSLPFDETHSSNPPKATAVSKGKIVGTAKIHGEGDSNLGEQQQQEHQEEVLNKSTPRGGTSTAAINGGTHPVTEEEDSLSNYHNKLPVVEAENEKTL